MRASIAKPNGECGSLLPLSPFHLRVDRRNKRRPHRKESLCGLESAVSFIVCSACWLPVSARTGSGVLAADGFVSPCEPAWACETRSILVPLSRWTFFPAEVITEPCVAFEAAALRFRPFKPKTPWLFEVS